MSRAAQVIRVKAMLVCPNDDGTAHVVSLLPPSEENPHGYHRLIGGSVEPGETHQDAIVREVHEELGATIRDLAYVDVVENIYRLNGVPGHEVIFVYRGRLNPQPAKTGATLTEADGSTTHSCGGRSMTRMRPCRSFPKESPVSWLAGPGRLTCCGFPIPWTCRSGEQVSRGWSLRACRG